MIGSCHFVVPMWGNKAPQRNHHHTIKTNLPCPSCRCLGVYQGVPSAQNNNLPSSKTSRQQRDNIHRNIRARLVTIKAGACDWPGLQDMLTPAEEACGDESKCRESACGVEISEWRSQRLSEGSGNAGTRVTGERLSAGSRSASGYHD